MKVVIAGAGLVGAATAIALRQAGHECTLYDRVHLAQTANGANEAVEFGEVGGVQTIVGKKLIGVVETKSCVTAKFADGTAVSGNLLIGADGVHSATRRTVFGADLKAEFTGIIGYIGVVNLKQHNIRLVDRCAFHVDRTKKHMVCVFKVSDEAATIQAVSYSDPDPEDSQDDAYRPYNDLPNHSARLADFLESWGAPAIHVEMMRKAHLITAVTMYDLPDLATYHKGRVLLIGDAAHGMLPNAGLGLSTGLEDVGILMELLKQLPSAYDLSKLLELFSRLRVPRGTEASQFSRIFTTQFYAKSRFGAGFSHFIFRACVFAVKHNLIKRPEVINYSEQVSKAIVQYSS
ncbi:hypothetical protein HDU98_000068 [Podochytrium sp. JEL0797]|nr:hypothetical protein HDU98_000068 [Podochytrium sp. JEL0797]